MNFQAIHHEAQAQAHQAAMQHSPRPMGVYQSDLAGNRLSPVEVISDGVCGFAWVAFKGNTAFGRWATKTGLARPDYPTGKMIWVSGYDQSMERKEKYAQEYCKVLAKYSIIAFPRSRMD